MPWSNQQIEAFAPNKNSFQRAQDISLLQHWPELWSDGNIIYGRCKGSSPKPYQVFFNYENNQYHCNCRSAKKPCKHLLSLLLMHRERGELFKKAHKLEDWVVEVIRKLSPDKKPPSPQNQILRDKNFATRIKLMQAGSKALESWLKDFVRQGVATIQNQPDSYWDTFSAQMVDFKLSGVSNKIKLLRAKLEDTTTLNEALGIIADLFLFVNGFKRIESLDESRISDLAQYGGLNIKKEALLQFNGTEDYWLVIGSMEGLEGNLKSLKTWFIGARTHLIRYTLDFAWGTSSFERVWQTGSAFEGTVVTYPGKASFRALIKSWRWSKSPFIMPKIITEFNTLQQHFSLQLSLNSWVGKVPYYINEVVPSYYNGQFFLVDLNRNSIPMAKQQDSKNWKILAASGNSRTGVFGEWDGWNFIPITAVINNRLIVL